MGYVSIGRVFGQGALSSSRHPVVVTERTHVTRGTRRSTIALRWLAMTAALLVPAVGTAATATAISAGERHTCAVTSDGAMRCWGWNPFGGLGDGTTTDRLTPVTVVGLEGTVVAEATGAYHSCAVTSSGAVQCWGGNQYGQLGDGTTTQRLTPVAVSGLGSGVVAVAAGFYHTCALTTVGAVQCWGANFTGRLGDGTTTQRLTPVQVSGLTSGVVAIAAGVHHTCAVTAAGAIAVLGRELRRPTGRWDHGRPVHADASERVRSWCGRSGDGLLPHLRAHGRRRGAVLGRATARRCRCTARHRCQSPAWRATSR